MGGRVPSSVEAGVVLDGTYKILRRIGDGGMGEVYEARHARLAGRYAVKVLNTASSAQVEAVARFRREAQVTSALRHPGIVQIIDFNTTAAGVAYLVMEYLEGANLETIIDGQGPQPLDRVVSIARQVASALTEAHRRGVVHRDLKPQNIFLVARSVGDDDDEPERAKVLDFGISKIRSASRALTETAVVLGTPQYMSPEQAEGKTAEVDESTDQFALAAIVYEMLTGRPAFNGDTLASVVYKVVHTAPEPVTARRPELPAAVERVVMRGLSKNKAARFASVADFASALREAAHGPVIRRRTSSAPTLPPPASTVEQAQVAAAAPAPRDPRTLAGPPAATRAGRAVAKAGQAPPRRLRATTLGRQTGELLRRMRATGTRERALGGAAVLTVIVAAALGVRWLGHSPAKAPATVTTTGAPAPTAPPAPAIRPIIHEAPPPPAPVAEFDIASDPPGIPLWVDGQPFPNPARQVSTRARGTLAPGPHTFELAKLGFQTWRRTVEMTPSTPTRFLARLRREEGSAGVAGWPPAVPAAARPGPAVHVAPAAAATARPAPAAAEAAHALPATTPAPTGACLLTVGSRPWAEVWIDGANTGRSTPMVNMALPCGSHRLELRRRDLKIEFTTDVTLIAGRVNKQKYYLEPSVGAAAAR